MATYIDAFFAASFLIVCLSHAAQPRLWADFFVAVKRTGFAPLIIGLYTLPFGMLIVLGHNVWTWDWPVFVTLAGWGMLVKATIYLLFPAIPNRMIDNADRWERGFSVFRIVGVLGALPCAVLTWQAFRQLPVG
jgi:hypothetical protein